MTSQTAIIHDLERIESIAEARANESDLPGEFSVRVIGHQFSTELFDLCQFDYRLQTIDAEGKPDLHLTLDKIKDASTSVFVA